MLKHFLRFKGDVYNLYTVHYVTHDALCCKWYYNKRKISKMPYDAMNNEMMQ